MSPAIAKHLGPFVLAALVGFGAAAETRTVDVGDFDAVDAANGVSVEITLGAARSVVVDGPDDQIDRVEVAVSGDTLRVRPKGSGWFRRTRVDDATVRVSAPSLSEVEVANGAQVSLEDVPEDAELELAASNGGVLQASGACRTIAVEAHRGGMVRASDLECREAEAKASMGGLVSVRAVQSVDASASMGGLIEVYGEAEHVSSSASMGGMVSRQGEGSEE